MINRQSFFFFLPRVHKDSWPPLPSVWHPCLFEGKLNSCVVSEFENMTFNQTNRKQTLKHRDRPEYPSRSILIVYQCHVCLCILCVYGKQLFIYNLYIKVMFTSAKTASVARQQQEALGSAPLSSECSNQVREKQWDRYWRWSTETDCTADHWQGRCVTQRCFIYQHCWWGMDGKTQQR